jgi:hypothetical protein
MYDSCCEEEGYDAGGLFGDEDDCMKECEMAYKPRA